jgi:hypothetical protein
VTLWRSKYKNGNQQLTTLLQLSRVWLVMVISTVKIPLNSLDGEKMQNLRSALNRVTREKKIPVETSSDEKYLYVWRTDAAKNTEANE